MTEEELEAKFALIKPGAFLKLNEHGYLYTERNGNGKVYYGMALSIERNPIPYSSGDSPMLALLIYFFRGREARMIFVLDRILESVVT